MVLYKVVEILLLSMKTIIKNTATINPEIDTTE